MGLVYSKGTSVNKTDKDLCSHGAYVLAGWGKSTINMNIINELYCMIDKCSGGKRRAEKGCSSMHGGWAV